MILLTDKCFIGLAPAYSEELLDRRHDRGSRKDNDNFLIVPKVNRVTFDGNHIEESSP